MKRKVRLTHTVELVVEAKTEDELYEFLLEHTPSEVKALVHSRGGTVEESYDEEVLDAFSENELSEADYVIK